MRPARLPRRPARFPRCQLRGDTRGRRSWRREARRRPAPGAAAPSREDHRDRFASKPFLPLGEDPWHQFTSVSRIPSNPTPTLALWVVLRRAIFNPVLIPQHRRARAAANGGAAADRRVLAREVLDLGEVAPLERFR